MKKTALILTTALAMTPYLLAEETIIPKEKTSSEYSLYTEGSSFYSALGYSYISADIYESETGNAYTLIAGYTINDYVSIEGRYSKTFGDLEIEGGEKKDKLIQNGALYIKPNYEISEGINIYGLIGYGEVVMANTSGDGFQWGLGMSYKVSPNVHIFIDYTDLYDGTLDNVDLRPGYNVDTQVNATTFGVTYYY
ncbi:MAG: outer membrane beta-barrel protein [Sulfurovum sp.]|nr:outer membrane beta-barrel protein [Sulfurovum sp.]